MLSINSVGGRSVKESKVDVLSITSLCMVVLQIGYEYSWKCLVERAVDLKDGAVFVG